MPLLELTTAGESHGTALVATLANAPAGIPITVADINHQLARRQSGYGRGRRMKIETDQAQILSGIRAAHTLGSPIALMISNNDWKNWQEIMSPELIESDPAARKRAVTRPRPGHADLVGMLKYHRDDARDILERASARETTARVAAAAICRKLLHTLGIHIGSYLTELGGITARRPETLPADINAAVDDSPLRTFDPDAEACMIERIDQAKRDGDTLGGVCEIVVTGLPAGLGSHVSWNRKLDGRLAAALMSIQAVKGVEIGLGFQAARVPGSQVHDEILPDESTPRTGRVARKTNNAGGLEGGITTGEPLVLRAAMKPISTLMRPLGTIEVPTRAPAASTVERSDVTAVPAMGVVAEAMTAFIVADAILEKFGADTMTEIQQNYDSYLKYLATRDQ